MIGFGNFERWESELAGDSPDAEVQNYLDSLPKVRAGLWETMEHFAEKAKSGPVSSLEYTKSIQQCTSLLPKELRLEELFGCYAQIEEYAEDVRGQRTYLTMSDGALSADVGGYTIMADSAKLALRLYEIDYGASFTAGRHKETGRRLAQEQLLPVLAVRSLALISRHAR